jgi:hypothetical protein
MVNCFVQLVNTLIVDIEADDGVLFGEGNGEGQANVAEADDGDF